MVTQSEAELENKLIAQLKGLNYDTIVIPTEEDLLINLKSQLEVFNTTKFTDREFDKIINHLSKGNIFAKAQTLRDRYNLTRDDDTTQYIRFFDDQNSEANLYQVTNQVTIQGKYENRYDVTLLVNGLPLVQIELKRRGIELKEAFNQIGRYQNHSFGYGASLFHYVQIFVISNGVDTKYFANNPRSSFKFTCFWAKEDNHKITDLTAFTKEFLKTPHIHKMIAHYVIQNFTDKALMVLRPYQFYATESIINKVKTSKENGYIWHTTGSGKTLTSFKTSQLLQNNSEVKKVVFVVDRKDLDYQTIKEFNAFKEGSVDGTDNTKSLVSQLSDDSKLIVTTIQKLNNAISSAKYSKTIEGLKDQRVVFIFDECHRSQFGETHKRITDFFTQAQLFGFTGTPIFADNATGNGLGKRTTKDLFGDCLHKYVITDAIRDENVLRFNVEYLGKYKKTDTGNQIFLDVDVEDIDTKEVLEDEGRIEKIVDYVISHHDIKTHNKKFSAVMAVSNIASLIKYYDIFKRKKDEGLTDLRVGTIFSYAANEANSAADGGVDDEHDPSLATKEKAKHSREKLDEFIVDYNKMYGQSYSTKNSKDFDNYFKDLTKRMKEREKDSFKDSDRLDILLVVNMFLTGFDAKKINTLYVDKNLKHHGLIQAFSRTNRILSEEKAHGNVVCFRNLKAKTDEAITLFSNTEAIDTIVLPPYQMVVDELQKAFDNLNAITPTVQSVDLLKDEEEEAKFVQAFRQLMRIRNQLRSYSQYDWSDFPMSEQDFEDFKSKYLGIKEKYAHDKTKTSIINEIDFELELIHRDEINVAYILKLIAQLSQDNEEEYAKQKEQLIKMLSGDVTLRSKRELIEKFINEQLPLIEDLDEVSNEFQKFWHDEKVMALAEICKEEQLDKEQFNALMEAYVFSGKEPLGNDVIKCLAQRPSILQAAQIGQRIIDRMREYVDVFVNGMIG